MKAFLCGLSFRKLAVFFGVLYAIALAMALFPPLYLWSSGQGYVVLGMPVAIWYWLLNAVLTFVVVGGLYYVESVRGELDAESATTERTGD